MTLLDVCSANEIPCFIFNTLSVNVFITQKRLRYNLCKFCRRVHYKLAQSIRFSRNSAVRRPSSFKYAR